MIDMYINPEDYIKFFEKQAKSKQKNLQFDDEFSSVSMYNINYQISEYINTLTFGVHLDDKMYSICRMIYSYEDTFTKVCAVCFNENSSKLKSVKELRIMMNQCKIIFNSYLVPFKMKVLLLDKLMKYSGGNITYKYFNI